LKNRVTTGTNLHAEMSTACVFRNVSRDCPDGSFGAHRLHLFLDLPRCHLDV
jgi:hypothetical protein